MGRAGLGPEFHVLFFNSGSGRAGSLHLWVGSKKLDPRITLHWLIWPICRRVQSTVLCCF